MADRLPHGTILTTGDGMHGRVHYEVLAPELDDLKGRIAAEVCDVPRVCAGEVGDRVYIDPRDIHPGGLGVFQSA